MRVEIIHHKDDFFGIRVHGVHQIPDFLCPVDGRTVFPHTDMMCPSKRFHESKYTDCPITDIFGIRFLITSWNHWQGLSGFTQKLVCFFVHAPFFMGLFAGTFLWQSIGEDLWNFSVNGINFVQLESVSVFPIFVMTILFAAYAAKNHALDFGMWCVLLGFFCNWAGHYVMLGTYPFVAPYFEEAVWNKGIAYISGAILGVIGIYLGICAAKDRKGRLFAAIITYIATGIIAFGMMEG